MEKHRSIRLLAAMIGLVAALCVAPGAQPCGSLSKVRWWDGAVEEPDCAGVIESWVDSGASYIMVSLTFLDSTFLPVYCPPKTDSVDSGLECNRKNRDNTRAWLEANRDIICPLFDEAALYFPAGDCFAQNMTRDCPGEELVRQACDDLIAFDYLMPSYDFFISADSVIATLAAISQNPKILVAGINAYHEDALLKVAFLSAEASGPNACASVAGAGGVLFQYHGKYYRVQGARPF